MFLLIKTYIETTLIIHPFFSQLPCQLQYWDHTRCPGGQFVTYAAFSLPDSQITEWLLVMDKNERLKRCSRTAVVPEQATQNGLKSILDRAIQTATASSAGKRPDMVQAGLIALEPCDSDRGNANSSSSPTGINRVSSKLWRILVDLRARSLKQPRSP